MRCEGAQVEHGSVLGGMRAQREGGLHVLCSATSAKHKQAPSLPFRSRRRGHRARNAIIVHRLPVAGHHRRTMLLACTLQKPFSIARDISARGIVRAVALR